MQRLIRWCSNHWLAVASITLLAFIPLYPKLPLLDIKNTWVYVRLEDFLVLFVLFTWAGFLVQGRVSLKTPLTLPIFLFFLAGAIATLHSIVLIYPTVSDIYPNVAFLSLLRRMEYMSLFFIAYSAVKDRRVLPLVLTTLTLTVFAASVYGIGQKYAGFPAILTMNEEFAKGEPIRLSALSRVSSTFGGHYDFAAFLVLTIPILIALSFGIKRMAFRAVLLFVSMIGIIAMFMTVSRISVAALGAVLAGMIFVIRKRLFVMLVPIAVIVGIAIIGRQPGLIDRFTSTIKTTDVLIDAESGNPIGHVEIVPNTYFKDKTVHQQFHMSMTEINKDASPSVSFVVPYDQMNETVVLLKESLPPTGENLPAGSGYINLTLSPNVRKSGEFLYEPEPSRATASADVFVINGEYLVKRAAAYDLSFTTRFQGEWPKALAAFKRNVLFGSGYGSVSLAVDNSYLRMLGETGIFGFVAFLSIFFVSGAYVLRARTKLTNPLVLYASVGLVAGIAGLFVNALFIDVFEASKVAFTLWLLLGFVLGTINLYARMPFQVWKELKRMATSSAAFVLYIAVFAMVLFSQQTRNYFVGDDYTWLRWAASCTVSESGACLPVAAQLTEYVTQANGFFYRPATKIYFWTMYRFFWLNPQSYHSVSLVLHAAIGVLVFLLGRVVFSRKSQAALTALLFVTLSASTESVIWISATGHLFAACLMLITLLLYIDWRKKGSSFSYAGAIVSYFAAMMFHEFGLVAPLLFVAYEYTLSAKRISLAAMFRNAAYLLFAVPAAVYLVLRGVSQSHWLNGDYSYNVLKFPVNAIGNFAGYALVTYVGPFGMAVQQQVRIYARSHAEATVMLGVMAAVLCVALFKRVRSVFTHDDGKIAVFSLLFSTIVLLPFLGLGNITLRYNYVGAIGFMFLFVLVLRRLYAYVLPSGKDSSVLLLGIVAITFVLWHVVALQGIHLDWYHAGEKARRFIVSIDDAYENYWATEPMELNFVDVPIRHGEAWVFPVGIEDALWFVFNNPAVRVASWDSQKQALEAVDNKSPTQKVFVFTQEGKVWEVQKPQPEPALSQ